jgi:uncharacterized linocin/CFP29 family protein
MDHLRRSRAPLPEEAWKQLDEAVAAAARHLMAARRIATFDGPKGWDHVASRQGTVRACPTTEGRASLCLPDVALLAEIRVDFSLSWDALEAFQRGAPALDTAAAEAAGREAALAEDRLAFYGEPTGTGFLQSPESPRVDVADWAKGGALVADLLRAVETLDGTGIPGPYEVVLPPAGYYAYFRAVGDGGYPSARQLRPVLAGVHRSSVLRGAGAVFSTRGGDFILTVGGDLSVGYRHHDRDGVHLVGVETVTAQALAPQAVCLLRAKGR